MLAALAALLLVLLPAPSALAAPSPGQEIADRLRDSPVYVHDAYTGAVDRARQREIAARIEKTGLPVKVVLVPLAKGDDFAGDPGTLAEVVRGRLGDGDLILVTTSEQADWLQGFEWPGDAHQAQDAVGAVGHLDEMTDAGLAARVDKAVELIAAGNGTEVYDEAVADLGTDGPPADLADEAEKGAEKGADDSGSPLPPVLGGAAVALVLAAGALLYARRRGAGSRAATAPFATPHAVFAAARAADEAELRRRAEEEVVALGEAVREVEADGSDRAAHLHAALDAYAAAGTVLDGARSRADLAGVLALVAEGRDAMEAARTPRPRRTVPLPLCFFNPLHGRATHRTRWRPLGSRRQLPVAACDTCTTALRERRAPEVLTDTADDREIPYFEVPAESSVWAATGYGSLTRDPLAPRIARGDFTHSRG
ncbi:hypothetical protein QBL21_31150 [Streptomyces sp. 184]